MQFYLRQNELKGLKEFIEGNKDASKIILVSGNRKVGKTALINHFLKEINGVYITITPKSTALQLRDISNYLQKSGKFNSYVPEFESWKRFLEFLFSYSKEKPFTIAFDEFQNMEDVEPDFFQVFKEEWDARSDGSKLNIIFSSFDKEFIGRTFYDEQSPLYKITDFNLKLYPFELLDVISIFKQKKSPKNVDEIVNIYLTFGGYPKYYRLFDLFNLWEKSFEEILRTLVFQQYAPLGNELKDLILNHFTRENKVYISALQAIAAGHNTLTVIADKINIKATTLSKYLLELETKKNIIKRVQPLNLNPQVKSKFGKYYIKSYFENFWFRFVQPEMISYDAGNFDKIIENVLSEFENYKLQRIHLLLKELIYNPNVNNLLSEIIPENITAVGSLWNRKESVDIVAVDDKNKEAFFANVYKGENEENQLKELGTWVKRFDNEFNGYQIQRMIFHPKDFSKEMATIFEQKGMNHFGFNKILTEAYEIV